MSRTKCSFCFAHVSRLESLVFLWPRRAYGGSCKTSSFRRLPRRLSCCFAWQAWHFGTFQPVLYRVESDKTGGSLARNARFDAPPHSTLYTLHSTLYTVHSTLYKLHTPHSTLYILIILHTLHSALDTLPFTLSLTHPLTHLLTDKLPLTPGTHIVNTLPK